MHISHWHRAKLRQALRLATEHYGVDQQTLVERAGRKFSAADLSRAKNGELGDKRWGAIADALTDLAREKPTKPLGGDALAQLADDLRSAAPDHELERAYVASESLRSVNAPLWKKTPVLANTPLHGVVGPIGLATERFQLALKRKVVELHHQADQQGPTVHLNFSSDSEYSSVLNWTRCRASPLLLLFPFFLTAERRMSWGVIPYGRHRSLGLLLPFHVGEPTSNTSDVSPEMFLEYIEHHDLAIRSAAGYVEEQIVFEMALDAGEAWLRRVERVLRSTPNATFPEISADLDPNRSCLMFGLERLDEARRFLATADNSKAFHLARLHHGIDVPAGIGFSFPTIPWLETGHRYADLQNAALSAAWTDRDHFANIGIEITSRPAGELK